MQAGQRQKGPETPWTTCPVQAPARAAASCRGRRGSLRPNEKLLRFWGWSTGSGPGGEGQGRRELPRAQGGRRAGQRVSWPRPRSGQASRESWGRGHKAARPPGVGPAGGGNAQRKPGGAPVTYTDQKGPFLKAPELDPRPPPPRGPPPHVAGWEWPRGPQRVGHSPTSGALPIQSV